MGGFPQGFGSCGGSGFGCRGSTNYLKEEGKGPYGVDAGCGSYRKLKPDSDGNYFLVPKKDVLDFDVSSERSAEGGKDTVIPFGKYFCTERNRMSGCDTFQFKNDNFLEAMVTDLAAVKIEPCKVVTPNVKIFKIAGVDVKITGISSYHATHIAIHGQAINREKALRVMKEAFA